MCKDYRGIQERVMNKGMVTRETQTQLPDINRTILSQWYIKRQKKKEQEMLKQGLPQRTEAAASKTPLPEAILLPTSLPQVNFPVPFKFILPTNTTGTATLRGPTPKACPPLPILPAPVPFLQPPTVERRFHHVAIQPKITTQHHQPEQHNQSGNKSLNVNHQQTQNKKMKQGLPKNRKQAAVISNPCMTWFAPSVERREIMKIINNTLETGIVTK